MFAEQWFNCHRNCLFANLVGVSPSLRPKLLKSPEFKPKNDLIPYPRACSVPKLLRYSRAQFSRIKEKIPSIFTTNFKHLPAFENVSTGTNRHVANAMLASTSSTFSSGTFVFSHRPRMASTGPMPIIFGSHPITCHPTTRTSGSSFRRLTASSLARRTAAAPSVMPYKRRLFRI